MDYVTEDMGLVVELPDMRAPWQACGYRNPYVAEAAGIGSFEEYCKGHFGWGWLRALETGLSEGSIPTGRRSPKVRHPEVAVAGASIVRVEFSRLDRMRFYADAVIAAQMELSEYRDGKRIVDTASQWYRNRFLFRAFPDGYDLEELAVTIYDKSDGRPGLPLSKYLIPVLSEENTETEAEEMLRQYYPEALMEPQPVNAMLLAERMGLTVLDVPLCEKEPLMGKSVFYEGRIPVGDKSLGQSWDMPVEPGMILINTLCGMDDIQRNSTIIHECVHHYEHDLFIWAQRLYKEDVCSMNCPAAGNSFTLERRSPVFWAEMQARLMTYRIKMNRLQAEHEIQVLNASLSGKSPAMSRGRHLETVISRFAAYFQTSKQCARKRMLELGYEQVRGVMNYVNGEYIPPYFFAEGALAKHQTFAISLQDAVREYGRNRGFRRLIDSGRYVYVEGKFCRNRPEYVRMGRNGKLGMTQEARLHAETCCLKFEYSFDSREAKYVEGILNREERAGQTSAVLRDVMEPGACSPDDFLKEAGWITAVRKKIGGMDFCEALVFLMRERRCTIEKLEERSRLSTRTISRLRNETGYGVTCAHVVALSIGLKLPPAVSGDLLDKAGLKLRNDLTHNVYRMILSACYMVDIGTVNSYLERMGLEPLSDLVLL